MIYTRADLKSRINAGIKGKQGILVDFDAVINEAVREVISELDLRTMKRKTTIVPALFDDISSYPVPADLKDYALVSIRDQGNKTYDGIDLISSEEWGQNRKLGTVAFDDHDLLRILKVTLPVTGASLPISTLDSLTAGGGTWALFGDAVNVEADAFDYVRGSGSMKFDISAAGGTTAGIQNVALDAIDISPYLVETGAVFVFAYITDSEDITNYIFRIGSDSSNYYEMTAIATHEGAAFATGWNLLRFDLDGATEVGTVVPATCIYSAAFMTKDAGKISEADYRFDYMTLKNGDIHEIIYYSKYGWIDATTGVYKENSSADADKLTADTTEFNMFIQKGIEIAGPEVDEERAAAQAAGKYTRLKDTYGMNNPSEKLYMLVNYMANNFI